MRDTQSQGADDLRARLEEAERDGKKLQQFNQRLAARVAELEKQHEAGKAPACECPTRDLAVEVAETYTCKHPPDDGSDDPCDGTDCMRCAALAALSAPCPLRAELAELRAEHESAGKRWAKTFIENDSLRAELAKTQAYAEFEESRIVKICEVIGAEDIERAAEKITRLRAKVEAVRAIADQARLGDRDLRGALEAIDAALKEGK